MPFGNELSASEAPVDGSTAVEHDGRLYTAAALLRHLSPDELEQVEAAAPRSVQELWDEAVRRWPALTSEIVAGARPAVPFAR